MIPSTENSHNNNFRRNLVSNGMLAVIALILLVALAAITLELFSGWPYSDSPQTTTVDSVLQSNVLANTQINTQERYADVDRQYSNEDTLPIVQRAEGYGQAKNIVDTGAEIRLAWTPTPQPTRTPVPLPTPVPTVLSQFWQKPNGRPAGVGLNERWVDVDLSEQTLYAYEGDALIFQTLISSGLPEHPTVTGQFRVWLEYEKQTMDGRLLGYDYYLEDVPFVMYFFEDYALHGTYWHNNFGTPMSHGCVNMATEDAGWVYSWATVGTVVNVHE